MKSLFKALLMLSLLLIGNSVSANGFKHQQPQQRIVAPAFSLPDLDGNPISLSEYSGKLVLINFWATWCAPCRKEMPGMQELWLRYEDQGLVMLGVSADKGSLVPLQRFVSKLGLTFPIVVDQQSQLQDAYQVTGLPMSYIIGRDGKISARIIGAREWNDAAAYEYIESML